MAAVFTFYDFTDKWIGRTFWSDAFVEWNILIKSGSYLECPMLNLVGALCVSVSCVCVCDPAIGCLCSDDGYWGDRIILLGMNRGWRERYSAGAGKWRAVERRRRAAVRVARRSR